MQLPLPGNIVDLLTDLSTWGPCSTACILDAGGHTAGLTWHTHNRIGIGMHVIGKDDGHQIWSKLPSLTTRYPAASNTVLTMLRSSSEAWLPFLKAIRAPTDFPSCHFMPSFEKACNIFTPLPAASCCMYPISVACLGSLLYMTCSKYIWLFAPDWMASRQTGLKSCNHPHPSKFGLQQIVTRPKIPHAYQAVSIAQDCKPIGA